MLGNGIDPARIGRAPVELARDHEHERVGRRIRRKLYQDIGTLFARCRVREANFQDLALCKQRQRLTVCKQRVPIEAALDRVQVAFRETARARLGAYCVGRFAHKQRLVTGHQIHVTEPSRELVMEVVAGDLH